jgi:2',3'-cyclic-nucleotide 2'-phosphodiesterase (5'-nucleotidase family)
VLDFDRNGKLINTFEDNGSGVYATTDEVVQEVAGADAFTEGTKGELVKRIADAVNTVVNTQDTDIYGTTAVYLEGRREAVRTEETNLGNLTADANLAFAKQFDPAVQVSIKNGGGIRAAIGTILDLGNGNYEPGPPPANPETGKEKGQVSQLDIKNSLRFNNALTVLDLTATELLQVVEHAVSATAEGSTPGQFPQIGGMAFSFDPALPAGDRVQTLVLLDADGNIFETVVEESDVVGDPNRIIKIVTLNFLADGGDGYPFPVPAANRVDLNDFYANDPTGTFAALGTEQDALAQYLSENHPVDGNTPFAKEETLPETDERIQNLSRRTDGLAGQTAAASTSSNTLKTYPIPMQNRLFVEIPDAVSGEVQLRIIDVRSGTLIYDNRHRFDDIDKVEMDVSWIRNTGVYALEAVLPDGAVKRKILIK